MDRVSGVCVGSGCRLNFVQVQPGIPQTRLPVNETQRSGSSLQSDAARPEDLYPDSSHNDTGFPEFVEDTIAQENRSQELSQHSEGKTDGGKPLVHAGKMNSNPTDGNHPQRSVAERNVTLADHMDYGGGKRVRIVCSEGLISSVVLTMGIYM